MKSIKKFEEARDVLKNIINETNLIYCDRNSKLLDANIYFKPENLQKTGSYKIRGAYYKVSLLSDEEKEKGLITASAGNHAQGVAFTAKKFNIKSVIVMPVSTPLVKINNTKAYGAEVILYGDFFDESFQHAKKLAEEKGYTFIHPFDDLDVATGQGTIAYEILQQLPETDIILLPIGGGGLCSGVSTLAKLLKPSIKIIGVEPEGAASMKKAIENKKVVALEKVETIADGVAVQKVGEKIFPYVQKNLDEIIIIQDHELVSVFLYLMEDHKIIVENAGLLSVAAIKHLKNIKGKNIVSILSGGNMDVLNMASLIQHGLIERGRIFTFVVKLPNKPGELASITNIIAKEQGSVIHLEHDQFVNINRNMAVGVKITLEVSGYNHKNRIIKALEEYGYTTEICHSDRIF